MMVTPGVFSGGFARGAGVVSDAAKLKEVKAQNLRDMQQSMIDNTNKNAETMAQAFEQLNQKLYTEPTPEGKAKIQKRIEAMRSGLNAIIEGEVNHYMKAGMDPMLAMSAYERATMGTGKLAEMQAQGAVNTQQAVATEAGKNEVSPIAGAKWVQDENGDLVAITKSGDTKNYGKLKISEKGGNVAVGDITAHLLGKILEGGYKSLKPNERSVLELLKKDPQLSIMLGEAIGNALDRSGQLGGSTPSDLPEGVTEEEIQHTMKIHNLSREEVIKRITQ